jgi:hypothetical protein
MHRCLVSMAGLYQNWRDSLVRDFLRKGKSPCDERINNVSKFTKLSDRKHSFTYDYKITNHVCFYFLQSLRSFAPLPPEDLQQVKI